jgi:hypothetical protein
MSEEMINAISTNMGYPPTPEEKESYDSFKDMDYVFYSELHLSKIDTIFAAYWEEVDDEDHIFDYEAADALGDYSINIRLVNARFNEKVWEGQTAWNGRSNGYPTDLQGKDTPNAVGDLGASMSPKIDKLIYDYERNPMNCVIEMEKESVSAGEEIMIRLTGLTDDKGRPTRPWQRLVIRLEQGKIMNATEHSDEKQWVVLAGEGDVELQYKAPSICQKEKEILTVFNSCFWGGPGRPMNYTPPKKKLTSKTFDIIPSQPKDCKINVDHKTDYPPFFNLEITNITDEKGKIFPSNNYVALKADKGIIKIKEGRLIDGWRIYPTTEGRITEKVNYTPPQCAISESDIIEIAQVCEDKNGKMSIGSTKFTKKINNPLCSDATLSITSRYLREIKKDRKDDNGDTKTSLYIKDQSGTITLQLKRHSEMSYAMFGLHWVYYMSTSRSLNNWHVDYYDHRDEESKYHTFSYREDAEISNVKIITPDYPIMVIIMYDTETKKAKYMIVQASLIMGYEMNISINTQSTDKNGTTSDSRTKYEKESYSFEIVGDEILDSKLNKKIPSGALAKGSKNTFTGYGKTEVVKSLSETYFHEERNLKTSQWTMTIND